MSPSPSTHPPVLLSNPPVPEPEDTDTPPPTPPPSPPRPPSPPQTPPQQPPDDMLHCPCPCHESNFMREGRAWIAFSNAAQLVCPMCWVDAYTRAHGGDRRNGFVCETYLRIRGKDPKVAASKQC
ncbi:hypothetical protein F4814DRAFT_448995 [Daldinia grandis]|nr:hypothetical protein F4814DRAFT_448995 [Daldinia grandis]